MSRSDYTLQENYDNDWPMSSMEGRRRNNGGTGTTFDRNDFNPSTSSSASEDELGAAIAFIGGASALLWLLGLLSLIVAVSGLGLSIKNTVDLSQLTGSCEGLCSDGEDGVDGVDGIKGDMGSCPAFCFNGTDGTCPAFCFNGTDGTCPEFCFNGTDGRNGTDGINGTNGLDGVCAQPCVNGTNGLNGINGTNGLNGTCTQPCVNGTNGLDGVCAQPCVNGTNGLDGINGTNGLNGLNGTCTQPCVNGTNDINDILGSTFEVTDNTTGPNIVVNTLIPIPFNTNVVMEGWTHVIGSADLVANLAGTFVVSATVHVGVTLSLGDVTVLATLQVGGVGPFLQIKGSREGANILSLASVVSVTTSFYIKVDPGDVLQLNFATNNLLVSLRTSGLLGIGGGDPLTAKMMAHRIPPITATKASLLV